MLSTVVFIMISNCVPARNVFVSQGMEAWKRGTVYVDKGRTLRLHHILFPISELHNHK